MKTATDSTLSEIWRLGLHTKASLLGIAHHTHGAELVAEYACATTNVQRYSAGEKTEVVRNTSKEAMTLPAKTHWRAALDKEVSKMKNSNIYTLVPLTAVPTGNSILGSRCVLKVKADKSYKRRNVVLE